MEEEAEKYYIIRGLKENRAKEIQLQSCSNIEELKEKMKLLDIQEKSKSSKNEVIYPKYPMTRILYHTNQFAHRQQYGGWNWRNDQSQHPDTITNTRYKVYSPQFPSPYHHPSFSLQRPTLYPRNQRFPQRPTVLRPNAPTFYPRQRTQNNNTVFQPHQTRELMIIQGRINFKQVDVLLDTGSSINIIQKNIISQIKGYHNVEYIKTKIATINGEIESGGIHCFKSLSELRSSVIWSICFRLLSHLSSRFISFVSIAVDCIQQEKKMMMSETHSEKRKLGKAVESSANKKAKREVSKKYKKFTEDCIPDGVFPIGDDVFVFASTDYDSVSVHIRRFKKYGKTYYPTPEGRTLDPRWIEYITRKKKVPESLEELSSGLFPPERHIQITSENFIDFTFKRIKYGPDKETPFKDITISREQ
ncbi:hypothetical protein TNCV_4313771 [Trichonephila clavipes]|nr:hypothetical protein TNCV_4313771 [Trichonephila clavipes]